MHTRAFLKSQAQWKPKQIYIIAFAVPFLILCVAFALLGIYPFGDRQILVIDAWNQYYPFMAELSRKLKDGESLLYSWRLGMGGDFISLMAYYLASPLNILLVLFPPALLREVFTLFIMIKVGLAGSFCAFALNRMNGKKDLGVTIFSTFYALCGWTIGYYWNIMWLDSFAVFPLVALGVWLLVREKKYKLYTVALAVAIYANFYMGFMISVFVAVFFFVECYVQKNKYPEFLSNLKNIIVFSLVAIMMSAVAIVPTIIALQNAYKSVGNFGDNPLARGWLETFSNLFGYLEPTRMGGRPYLYSGVLCIILLIVFCRLSVIPKREKISYALLVVFVFASTNIKLLDYMWHGLHATQALPYRFTFILSFLLVMLAYRAFCSMDTLKKRDCLIVCAIYAALYFLVVLDYAHESKAAENVQDFLVQNLLVGAAYLAIIVLASRGRVGKKAMLFGIVLVAGLELAPTVFSGIKAIGTTDRIGYPDRYEAVEEVLQELAAGEEEDAFYRTELTDHYGWNAPALYAYNGVSVFSSLINVNETIVFENMGMVARQAGNKRTYQNSTPVNNMFINLKYLISRGDQVSNQEYLAEVAKSGDVYGYRNEAYLPIGFMVREELADYHFEGDTPFEVQNNLLKAATGIKEDVFQALDIIHVGHRNLYVTRPAYGMYHYRPSDDADKSKKGSFKFNYEMPEDGCAYVFMDLSSESRTESSVSVDFEGGSESYGVYNLGSFFPAGTYEKGDIFSVRSEAGAGKSGKLRIFVSVLDQKVFDKAYEILRDEVLHVTEFTSRSLKGTINVKEGGLMYTSVPYERGWRVYVDGERADIDLIFNVFMGVMLSEGEHVVEFVYVPEHVYVAVLISLLGIGIFLVIGKKMITKNKAA